MLLLACNDRSVSVTRTHVEATRSLLPYIESTYRFLSGDLGTGERYEFDRAVMTVVEDYEKTTGKPATARDIMRKLPRSLQRDAGSIRRTLEDLCAVGLLDEKVNKPERGRPTTTYSVKAG
jgi:hypothetical protein